MFDINEIKKNVTDKLTKSEEIMIKDESAHNKSKVHGMTSNTSKQMAVVGPSIHIKGELTGEEGLIIEGSVEGTIDLKENQLIIGEKANINADVFAKSITVDGVLNGKLNGLDKVHISKNGKVEGDIHSPRVIIEDGAKFRGNIDMSSNNINKKLLNKDDSSGDIKIKQI